jgi:hypothetical protein
MTTKEALHRLIDELPEAEMAEAERLLKALQIQDPVLRAIEMAPLDDEPETGEERAAVQEARDQAARGELIDDADLVL